VFQHDLAKSLAIADEALIANVFKSESIPAHERLDVAAVATEVGRLGRRARVLTDVESIVQISAPEMRAGDIVAILSNGGFEGIYEKLPQRLRSLNAESAVEARAQRS
jgi:UDP-N-acetylmuramate: L-alanyl-gamma-D-glutamyl-meso-diaminopimelate ligase